MPLGEKFYSILLICYHIGQLIMCFIASTGYWYSGTFAVGDSSIPTFFGIDLTKIQVCDQGQNVCTSFFWSNICPGDGNLCVSVSSMVTGGVLALFAIIFIMIISLIGTAGHVMRIIDMRRNGFINIVSDLSFAIEVFLWLFSLLAFSIAWTSADLQGFPAFGTVPSFGLGIAVVGLLIAFLFTIARYVPPVYEKISFEKALLSKSLTN